jgi:hypothetical protein
VWLFGPYICHKTTKHCDKVSLYDQNNLNLKSVLKRSNGRVLLNEWKNNKTNSIKKIKFDEIVYQRLILNDEQVDKILVLKDKDIVFEPLELIVIETQYLTGDTDEFTSNDIIDVLSLTTVDAPHTILNDQMIQPQLIQDQNYIIDLYLNWYNFIMVVWHYFIV